MRVENLLLSTALAFASAACAPLPQKNVALGESHMADLQRSCPLPNPYNVQRPFTSSASLECKVLRPAYAACAPAIINYSDSRFEAICAKPWAAARERLEVGKRAIILS